MTKTKQIVTKTETSPSEIYSSIAVSKESTKPISFRVDSESYKKITTLEKTRKESKSAIIKEAIERTFSELIFSHINNELYKINKNIFDKIKVKKVMAMSAIEDDESQKDLPFMRSLSDHFKSMVIYQLDYPKYEDKEKVSYSLNQFRVELITEGGTTLKIKVCSGNVIDGNSQKIDPNLFMKVTQIASKNNFQTETDSDEKDKMNLNIFFERMVGFDFDKWAGKIKTDLEEFKKMINEVNSIFAKEPNFKELKK
ncbi:hypothetical protein HYV86_01095 [Candidatus Woesearchaeota archaeon]|nr:hypothetical protein [Candidatus Woesearchaeota archaeon]